MTPSWNQFAVLLTLCLSIVDSAPFDTSNYLDDVGIHYERDKIYQVVPKAEEEFLKIIHLRDLLDLDFWSEAISNRPGTPIIIRVPGESVVSFESHLDRHGIENHKLSTNVSELVRREYASNPFNFHSHVISKRAMLTSNLTKPTHGPQVVGAFASYEAIGNWMDEMCRKYHFVASCLIIGESYEKRLLKVMKIGLPASRSKQAIFLDANIHAREWLSGAAAIWLMNKLLLNYRTDGTVFDLLNRIDIYVFPIANPDGYEYSRQPARRYWRKTRSRTTRRACFGADPNRNFAYKWGTNGASTNPCSEVYQGPTPFSEPETKAMADFMRLRKRNMIAYFAIHSYGNYWLIPWGFTGAKKPDDFDEMMRVAREGMSAVSKKSGQTWQVGNTVDLLYPAAGGSDDWAKSIGVKYSYTIELRPSSDDPQFGFVVETTEVEPAGIDLWTGINAAVRSIFAAPYRTVPTRRRLTQRRYYRQFSN